MLAWFPTAADCFWAFIVFSVFLIKHVAYFKHFFKKAKELSNCLVEESKALGHWEVELCIGLSVTFSN